MALKYGYEFCQTRSVTIKNSSLGKKAGLGLFARKHIPKNRIIDEYLGEILLTLPTSNEYVYQTSAYYIDASKTKCAMKFINHQQGKQANVIGRELFMDGRLFIISSKAIHAGQELFLNYGQEFEWKHSPVKQTAP